MQVARQIEGRLGKLGLPEFAIGIVQAKLGKGIAQFLIRLVDDIGKSIEKICPHAYGLGTLTRKEKSQTHNEYVY